jgi:hypothetical protein
VRGGRVAWQLGKDISYVPQQPYLSYGTLLEQLVYPLSVDGVLFTLDCVPVFSLEVRLASACCPYWHNRFATLCQYSVVGWWTSKIVVLSCFVT